MSLKPLKAGRLWMVLAFASCFSLSAAAIPNPVSRAGSISKTVVQKAYGGAKRVTVGSAHVVKDAGTTAWTATDSLVTHVRSAL